MSSHGGASQNQSMKILQLTKKFPYPPKDGESIAVTYLCKALVEKGCEMHLLSMNTTKHYIEVKALPKEFNHYASVKTVLVDNKVNHWGAFKNLFSSKSYHVSRFESEKYEQELIEVLKNNTFDIILMETLYLAPYLKTIRKYSKALTVMRAHNVEHEIWERLEKNTQFLPMRMYLKYTAHKLRNFEVKHLNDYDFLVPISDADLKKFRKLGYANGAHAIPIGLDMNHYVPSTFNHSNRITMGFIGSLDWRPNLEGITWFIKKIWPSLHKEFPDLELHIAGRKAPNEFYNLASDNLFIHGEVECAKTFMNQHKVLLVPLLSGSGMRAKILEGMALGRVVLSTTLGMEGIDIVEKETAMLADSVKEFKDALNFLYKNPTEQLNLAANARSYVADKYCHGDLAEELHGAIVAYKQKQKNYQN